MTQKEYIKKLRFYLALRLPHAELSEIVSDMEEFLLALPQMAKVKHRSVFPSALRKRPPDTFSQKVGIVPQRIQWISAHT